MKDILVYMCTNSIKYFQEINYMYLQLISTTIVWLGAVPIPLIAVQRYVPIELLLLSRTNCSPVNSTLLSLPLSSTLVQVMFGGGSPIAVHSNVIPGPPSTAVWLSLTRSNSGESVEKEIHIKNSNVIGHKQTNCRTNIYCTALTQGSVEPWSNYKKSNSGKN